MRVGGCGWRVACVLPAPRCGRCTSAIGGRAMILASFVSFPSGLGGQSAVRVEVQPCHSSRGCCMEGAAWGHAC